MTPDKEAAEEPLTGIRAMLVGRSVVLRIEDGFPEPDEVPTLTLTPAKALKLAVVLVRYAWRAAAYARRADHHEPGVSS